MALPTPTGTMLYFMKPGEESADNTWNLFGCVTSISIDESTKTTDVDLINNDTTGWSGSIVTSKTRTLEVSGLFKNTKNTGMLAGAFLDNHATPPGDTYTDQDNKTMVTPLDVGEGTSGYLTAGDNVYLAIVLPNPTSGTTYDILRFTRDNAAVDDDRTNEIVWTVESKRIEMSGSNPATYTIRFIINAGSLC